MRTKKLALKENLTDLWPTLYSTFSHLQWEVQTWWPRNIFPDLFFSTKFDARKCFCSWSTFPTSLFRKQHLPRRMREIKTEEWKTTKWTNVRNHSAKLELLLQLTSGNCPQYLFQNALVSPAGRWTGLSTANQYTQEEQLVPAPEVSGNHCCTKSN